MTSGINWRKFPRINSKIDAEVLLEGHPIHLSAITENIGTGGLCVILDKEVEKLEQMRIKLALEDGLTPIDCKGRVVWSIKKRLFGQKKPTFDVGIEFTEIDDDAVKRIKNFILKEERQEVK